MVKQNRLKYSQNTSCPAPPVENTHQYFPHRKSAKAGSSQAPILMGSWFSLPPWPCTCLLTRCKLLLISHYPVDCSTQASLSFTISWSLLRFMSTGSMIPSSHLIPYHPLLLLPSIFPSIRVFSSKSALRIRWPKYLSCILPGVRTVIKTTLAYAWVFTPNLNSMNWRSLFTNAFFPAKPGLSSTWRSYLQDQNIS